MLENPTLSETILNKVSSEPSLIENKLCHAQKGRRLKAALVLGGIWGTTITLYFLSWGTWVVLGLTSLLGIHVLRIFLAKNKSVIRDSASLSVVPFVSLIVAARNEEAVITRLITTLCNLDYPVERYELWVVDDQSTDRTGVIVNQLSRKYSNLKVWQRRAGSPGGKSGALNEVLKLTQGEIVGVFDADAQVAPNVLQQVIPLFNNEKVGAVQLQKAIANPQVNWLTKSQVAEMALDSYFQEQRISLGGIGELRGNGQFLRRSALDACGGWNEETITDDLDLTIRLHLNKWDLEFLREPAVYEEGVTNIISLWHQRNRWAEGGYQRYLDYWRFLIQPQIGLQKRIDLLVLWIIQYVLPTATVPDCIMSIIRLRPPMLLPLTTMAFIMAVVGMYQGIRRLNGKQQNLLMILLQTIRGMIFLYHWFIVMASVTVRVSIIPKRLKWVKTVHHGNKNDGLNSQIFANLD